MDPVSSKTVKKSISNIAEKNIQNEMNKNLPTNPDKPSSFEQLRLDKVNEIPKDAELKVNEVGKQKDMDISSTQKVQDNNPIDGLKNLTDNLEKSNVELDNLIKSVMQDGRSFSPSELMAMQAQIYQLTREIELTSKVVEQANQGIKTMLNQQV